MTTVIDGTTGVNRITDGSVVQADLAANVAGNGPAFSAYSGSNQTVTQSTFTKLSVDVEEYDTAGAYNNTTYRFQPTVAGYYQLTGVMTLTTTGQTFNQLALYKNGILYKYGPVSAAANSYIVGVSSLVFLNGSTDYVELLGQTTGATPTISLGSASTFFQGFLARAA